MIAHANSASNTQTGAGPYGSIPLTYTPVNGGDVLMIFAWGLVPNNPPVTFSISDTAGNTFLFLDSVLTANGVGNSASFATFVALKCFATSTTITVNFSGIIYNSCAIMLDEFSGQNIIAPLDQHGMQNITSNSSTGHISTTVTTTFPNEMVWVAGYTNGGALTPFIAQTLGASDGLGNCSSWRILTGTSSPGFTDTVTANPDTIASALFTSPVGSSNAGVVDQDYQWGGGDQES